MSFLQNKLEFLISVRLIPNNSSVVACFAQLEQMVELDLKFNFIFKLFFSLLYYLDSFYLIMIVYLFYLAHLVFAQMYILS